MIVSSLLAPLVPSVHEPTKAGLLELAALVAAVALPAVVRPADDERTRAAAADEFEAGYVVDHPARMARNWTGTSGSGTVRTYWLPIRRRYTRVQAVTWALIRFIRRAGVHEHLGRRDFLAEHLGPAGSPAGGPLVTGDPGGDGSLQDRWRHPPSRPERHFHDSLITIRLAFARAIARWLPRCPVCHATHARRSRHQAAARAREH